MKKVCYELEATLGDNGEKIYKLFVREERFFGLFSKLEPWFAFKFLEEAEEYVKFLAQPNLKYNKKGEKIS